MKDRDKANFSDLVSSEESKVTYHIRDYDFLLDSPDKEYVVFQIDEDKEHFYFGGKVLTDQMKHLDAEGFGDEIRRDGIPVAFTEKKSKKPNEQGRYNYYTAVTFFPDEDGKGMESAKVNGEPEKEDKQGKAKK
jgi:hypothetical protein